MIKESAAASETKNMLEHLYVSEYPDRSTKVICDDTTLAI